MICRNDGKPCDPYCNGNPCMTDMEAMEYDLADKSAVPPIFQELDGKWYWLDELWDIAHGPYETPEEATDAWMAAVI